jgi:hypothetical protein
MLKRLGGGPHVHEDGKMGLFPSAFGSVFLTHAWRAILLMRTQGTFSLAFNLQPAHYW